MDNQELKDFYATHQLQDDTIRTINENMVDYIIKCKPESVFEFGCNNGKNLTLLEGLMPNIQLYGIDVNQKNLRNIYTEVGDEITLHNMKTCSFDICFTLSVLNHIPEPVFFDIVTQLTRIARKHVICCECTQVQNHARWFPHDFEGLGFKKLADVECGGRVYTYFLF